MLQWDETPGELERRVCFACGRTPVTEALRKSLGWHPVNALCSPLPLHVGGAREVTLWVTEAEASIWHPLEELNPANSHLNLEANPSSGQPQLRPQPWLTLRRLVREPEAQDPTKPCLDSWPTKLRGNKCVSLCSEISGDFFLCSNKNITIQIFMKTYFLIEGGFQHNGWGFGCSVNGVKTTG